MQQYGIKVCYVWFQRLLKQHDRALMRTLFELGTVIHQVNGGLHETVSCQTVTTPALSPTSEQSTLTSALKWRPHLESDDCIQTSISHQQVCNCWNYKTDV
jgi:hypothetical protein